MLTKFHNFMSNKPFRFGRWFCLVVAPLLQLMALLKKGVIGQTAGFIFAAIRPIISKIGPVNGTVGACHFDITRKRK